jgi:hypothetical protein
MRDLKPLPRNIVQVEQSQINPYFQAKPDSSEGTVFSHNRGLDVSRKNDKIKDISIGLDDIDGAIQYYFDNVIKPNVIQNGNRVAVPVIFGDAERWKSVQNDGFYRDKDGKIMAPLIMYKRTGVEKNRTLGNKLDGNKTHLFSVFETRYNKKNFYDNFSVLTNRIPSKQYYVSVIPDYVTVTYECVLFTNFVEQNNKLIEAVQFASDSYWGDFKRWHFRTRIDTFAVTNLIEQGADRVAKTTFTMTLNGYLIPDTVNKELANSDTFYSPSQVVFGLETVEGDVDTVNVSLTETSQTTDSTSFIGGGTNYTSVSYTGLAQSDLTYISTNKTKVATSITPNIATFGNTAFLQPSAESGLPATSVANFAFFANGVNIPANAIISFVQSGANTVLTVDTSILDYTLDSQDEITAVGKFE